MACVQVDTPYLYIYTFIFIYLTVSVFLISLYYVVTSFGTLLITPSFLYNNLFALQKLIYIYIYLYLKMQAVVFIFILHTK